MFKSIVVGTDGSETAHYAVSQAVGLASQSGAVLHLVSACRPPSQAFAIGEPGMMAGQVPDIKWDDAAREEVSGVLRQAQEKAEAAGVRTETHTWFGDPADALVKVAETQKSDLIVVGNRGMTGIARAFLGSVPNKVSHHAPCDVLIVRTTG